MKKLIRILITASMLIALFSFAGCASCERELKSCQSEISGGLNTYGSNISLVRR